LRVRCGVVDPRPALIRVLSALAVRVMMITRNHSEIQKIKAIAPVKSGSIPGL